MLLDLLMKRIRELRGVFVIFLYVGRPARALEHVGQVDGVVTWLWLLSVAAAPLPVIFHKMGVDWQRYEFLLAYTFMNILLLALWLFLLVYFVNINDWNRLLAVSCAYFGPFITACSYLSILPAKYKVADILFYTHEVAVLPDVGSRSEEILLDLMLWSNLWFAFWAALHPYCCARFMMRLVQEFGLATERCFRALVLTTVIWVILFLVAVPPLSARFFGLFAVR